MIDRFLKNLYTRIDILQTRIDFIVNTLIDEQKRQRQKEINELKETPIEKFMYIEDGSVDTDELISELKRTNPEIKVIVYRQGSQSPYLIDAQSNNN